MADWSALRTEEYTGENRCWPCTVLNLLIVAVASLWLLLRRRRAAGAVVAAVGAGLVYLRGYAVPFTPAFAPRLVAASPLSEDVFHGPGGGGDQYDPATDERESLTATDLDGEAILRELGDAGVVEADGEMLNLADDVDADWRAEMDRLADLSPEELADEVRRTVPRVTEATATTDGDREWIALGSDGEMVARPVAIAELAAYRALGPFLDEEPIRLAGARSLRMFLEACPDCGTDLVETDEATCCGAYAKPRQKPDEILACPDCDQRLFTFPSE